MLAPVHKFLSKLSEKERRIFNITLIFVVLAISDRLFLGPALDKLRNMETEIAQQENSITRDLRFLSYKERILNESRNLSGYFAAEVKDDDVLNAEFLRTVERLASQSNVNLVKSNPSQSKKQKDYVEYYASLDCTGKLEDVITFMHSINSSKDLLKIVKFTMTPKAGTSSDVNASMMIVKLIINSNI